MYVFIVILGLGLEFLFISPCGINNTVFDK